MVKRQKILDKWEHNTPQYAKIDEVLAILDRFFPGSRRQSGSHIQTYSGGGRKTMKTEPRDLEYYLSLNYKIEIEPITPQEGGGFTARIPQFGSMGIVGDGETTQEALESLEESKRIVFETLLNKGEPIPEPENFDSYSGRVLVRMPKELHAKLTKDS